jgi:non-ribosomal peptide synthase protein (TIGR01720 family)
VCRLSPPEISEKMSSLAGRSELVFNYTGQMATGLSESALFRSVSELGGLREDPRHKRDYLLKCTANVSHERLILIWEYSENLHQRATIEKVANDFIEILRSLVAHCPSSSEAA